jgi:pimeloyl-ACP methyl ester carboxylesterase
MRLLAFASACVAIALATLGLDCGSSKPSFRPSFAAIRCPADVETFLLLPHSCGYLTVLEDRARPHGSTIRLLAVRVQPKAGAAHPEPIASLGKEIGEAPDLADAAGLVSSTSREVILLDQRGTGHSTPSLACPEIERPASEPVAEPLTSRSLRARFDHTVGECRDSLTDAGVHLQAYTPAAVADDLEDLRRLLGVRSWNLISWGTASRLVLEYARRHPQAVRALVLDSPQFPERDPVSDSEAGLTDAFDALVRTCRASRRCERRHPDLRHALAEAVKALDRSPVRTNVHGHAIAIDGAALVRVIRQQLSDSAAQADKVPEILDGALDGNVGAVASTLAPDRGMCIGYLPRCGGGRSLGAYLSFTCANGYSSPHGRTTAFGEADPYVSACRAWDVEPEPARRTAVTTRAPALVLRGEYDAFTPLGPIHDARATLPNAHVVMVPRTGHQVLGHVDCLREARSAWLVHPRSDPAVAGCLRNLPAATFGRV